MIIKTDFLIKRSEQFIGTGIFKQIQGYDVLKIIIDEQSTISLIMEIRKLKKFNDYYHFFRREH